MEAPVKVGDVLAGKYKVEKVLGAGAMGVVVAAHHLDLQQMVALKFMLPSALPDRAAGDRFLREAQAAGRLRGEHVARVMDFGRLEGGAPYIVMEFLEGEDLDQLLERNGPLSVELAAAYIAQACSGMAEAHAQGIVHRDLKPQNLFLTKRPDGSPLIKVLDFGISKVQGDAPSATATQSLAVMGSPAYMSPEQARSAKRVDARGDIYALGAILYQLVSGCLPFTAESVAGMLVAIVSQPPTPLRQVAPDVSPEFEALVLQCLEKDREKRPQTARELGLMLSRFSSLPGVETERVTGQNLAAEAAKSALKLELVVTTMQPSSRPNALSSDEESETPRTGASASPQGKWSRAITIGAGAFLLTLILSAVVIAVHSNKSAAVPVASATSETTSAAPAASPPPTMSIATATTPSAVPALANSAPPALVTPPVAGAAISAAKNTTHVSHADAGASPVTPTARASSDPSAAASTAAVAPKSDAGLSDRPE